MNNKKIIILMLITFFIMLIFIFTYYNSNNVSNANLKIKNETNNMDNLKIPDEYYNVDTIKYELVNCSEKSAILEYAYITPNYTKIQISYNNNNVIDDNILSNEEQMQNSFNNYLYSPLNDEYPYLMTANNKKFKPVRQNDGDGYFSQNIYNNIFRYNDTFTLTTNDATDIIKIYFKNEKNQVSCIELKKI